jgi:SpoVK/Ycf46/Vps4 family AAA+-type ATPase
MATIDASFFGKDTQIHNEAINNKPECWTDEIRLKIIKKYAQKYNMGVYALSDSMPSGIVKRTGVGFKINQPISKEKARQILVECTQEYIQEINNKKELLPYLENYPVNEKNIDLSIYIYDKNGDQVFYPNLGHVSLFMGNLEYFIRDPKHQDKHEPFATETFEEAVRRVKEEIPKEDLL